MAATRGQWLLRNPALAAAGRRSEPGRAVELALEENGTWSRAVSAGVEVRCLSGTVWVTLERDIEDHVLTPGDTFVCTRPGRLAMMAFEPVRVRVTRCSESDRAASAA